MHHHLRRDESFKTCESFDDVMNHLRRDKSRLYVVYMFVISVLPSKYIFIGGRRYLLSPSKYIFIRHRNISPIFVDKFPHKRVTSLHRLATGSASPGSAIRGHWE